MPVLSLAGGGESPGEVGLGVLTGEVGPELVDRVIEEAGCREVRRRLLPARVVVYFVLGLCLFSGADSVCPPGYRSVMRSLTNGLRHLGGMKLPTSPALTRARQRLGARPFELLFGLCRRPLAGPGTPGAFAFGLRLVAWDGTMLDVAGTAANAAAFGVTHSGDPQLRLVTLAECGTRGVLDAVFDGVGGDSELKLARRLLPSLEPGMLLLADRNFPGHELWGLAAGTGADLAWRIKKHLVFPPVRVLPDGSYLSVMRTPADNIRAGRARHDGRPLPALAGGHQVRIIEYAVTIRAADGSTRTERFRLVTTLLDHEQAPAAELAAVYHQRWEIENGYGELKTRLRGAGFILRSKSPELARQETWAFLVVWQALCALKTDAARQGGTDPDRISFSVTVRVARDHASSPVARTRQNLAMARRYAILDLLGDTLPERRDRNCERLKKRPKNKFPPKKRDHTRPPDKVAYKIEITRAGPLPAQTP